MKKLVKELHKLQQIKNPNAQQQRRLDELYDKVYP